MRGAKINDFSERYRKQIVAQIGNSNMSPNMESSPRHAPLQKKEIEGYNGPVGIVINEFRHRRTDYGGSCDKYVVDAIVSAGILQDDQPEIVQWIRKEQRKIPKDQIEQTIIEIWKV